MNKKTIEKAASEAVRNYYKCDGKYSCDHRNYCKFCGGLNLAIDCDEDCNADDFAEGFKLGAYWRINSVWHSPDEEPRKCDIILAEMAYEDGDTGYEVGWKAVPSMVRWAYVADLLPNSTEFDGIKKIK